MPPWNGSTRRSDSPLRTRGTKRGWFRGPVVMRGHDRWPRFEIGSPGTANDTAAHGWEVFWRSLLVTSALTARKSSPKGSAPSRSRL